MSDLAKCDGVLIAEIPKNSREILRISRRNFKGREMIDFRVLYRDTDGALRFGKGGFGIDASAAQAIADAVADAAKGV